METNVNYTVVGAFVILFTTVIILGIIWLSAGFSTEEYSTYKVYMQEAVSGLSIDAPVEYNGVSVGTVTSIKINSKNPRLVELLLKLKDSTPITNGTRAKLDVRSLSGVAYIALQDNGKDMRPLKAKGDQEYPVIMTLPSIFLRLDTMLTQLNESFHKLSGSVQSLLNDQNLQAIKQTLSNIRQVTDTLSANNQQLSLILHNTANAAQVITTQTLPAANEAIINLDTMTRNIAGLSSEIKQNPAMLIRGKEQPALGPGEK